MKKKFTFLMAALALLVAFAMPQGMWGQTRDTKTDVMFAKGFGGYTTNSYSAAGTDYSAVPNSTNATGVTYAMRVFNGSTGAVRGNQTGASNNYSCRNTTTYSGYYISSVSLTVSGGTLDGSNNNRSLVYFGTSAYSAPSSTAPSGTKVTASPNSSGQATLTWTNTNEDVSYFILYNLKTANTAISENSSTALTVVWTQKSGGGSTTYTVTYDANGATSGEVPTDANSPYANGATVTVLGNTGSLAKTGHTFSNWNTSADGSGASYLAGNTFTVFSKTTLFAQWTVNKHTVTLPGATTEGSYSLSYTYNNSTITSPVAVPYGVKVTLVFTPNSGYEDYEATWSVNGTPIANNGNKFTMPDANVIVTATVAKATSWTYTHTANDGTSAGTGQWTYIDNKFKVKQTKVGNTDIASNQDEIRLYKTHYLEITPSTGFDKVITSVELTCSANDYNFTGATYVAGANSSNTETVTATANNLVYTIDLSSITNCAYLKITAAGQQARITQIKVNYASKYTITYANNLTNGAFAPSGNPATSIAGKNITITTVPVEGYHLATLTYNDGTTTSDATVSGVTGTFTMPEANVIVNATFAQDATYTITYVENEETSFTDYNIPYGAIGDNLPDSPFNTVPVNLEFVGWSTSEIGTYTTTAPDIATEEFNVIDDATFYAVYKYDYSYTTGGGTPTWTKVTDDSTLQAGDQLVIASENAEAVAGDISSEYMTAETADFDGGLTLPDDAVILTLGGEEDDWTLANNSNELLGATNVKKLAWDSNDATNTWSISIENGDATIQNGTDSYGRFMYNVNSPRFTTYTSNVSETMLLPQLYRLEGGSTTVSGTYYLTSVTVRTDDATISSAIVWAGNNIIDAEITVANNGKLTVGGLLICPDVDFLTVNDGGQLVVSNSGVQATFQKNITGYDTSKDDDNPDNDGYKLIANPTIGGVAPSSVTGMLANDDYDLYYFKEAEDGYEWRNYRKETFTIDNGIGYLYAKPEDITLNFIGEVPTETSKSNISLSYTAGNAFAGFNLMGNPLSVNITSMKINTTSCGYYKLNNDGTFTGVTDVASEPVVVGQGFMVEASANTDKLHLNPTAKDEESFSNESIRLEVANSKYTDVTYICFGNMLPLTKINHMNDEAPMIYIHNESADNAVAVYNNRGEVKSVDVNFEAKTTGTYTISAKMMKGEVKYMHLYDRLTGIDTDLLMDDYSFIGAKSDIAGRFILNLESVDNNSSTGSDTFAYQSGNDIIVNGEGTLAVYDVTGRKVLATTINGVETINGLNSGVYIFRIIGETLRTQKIVVR